MLPLLMSIDAQSHEVDIENKITKSVHAPVLIDKPINTSASDINKY